EYLVQDFKCKIILIYNEDNLDEDSQTALETYREKVIDKEFNLNPTVDENLDFIFKDYPQIEIIDVIKEVFKKAGTNNIRVIRKTKWLIDEFIPLMKDWEESLRHQIIRNIIVINIAKLDTEFYINFPVIKGTNISGEQVKYQPKQDIIQQEIGDINWLERCFGFRRLQEMDEMILQLVTTSFLNRDKFN
ncbi:MAG: hypothetical protein ACKPFA_17245, partial [Dolichospermum sp.]